MRNKRTLKKDTVDILVSALCRDFPRRAKAIEEAHASRRTLIEFRYLNFKIWNAVGEIVSEEKIPVYIKEIGENVGYAKSAVEISEVAYKSTKRLIKDNIAKKLHLAD